MRRRDFIAGLGSTAAWPLVADAQQPALPVVSFISARSPLDAAGYAAAFRKGLGESGYVEGQNVTVEYHWLDGQYDRLPSLMADLVRRRVAAIATPAATAAAIVAKAALLQELVPKGVRVAVLVNPANARNAETTLGDVQKAARIIGLQIYALNASTSREIDAAFATLVRDRSDALFVSSDGFFHSRRVQFAILTARDKIPAAYGDRDYVAAGGLMSYGTDFADTFRQVGVYTGKILKGAKPADLPVAQSTKFELVINLQTASALGLTIPETLLATADEVIQ
jgi:putative ABC transport system substrate-binding protein